jgi:hypothetical protein
MPDFFKWNLCIILSVFLIFGCSKDNNEIQVTGVLSGLIVDAETGASISDVSIIVFDANTNAPTGTTFLSDVDGNYSTELLAGSYFIKLSKQGYSRVPTFDITPISFTIAVGQTFDKPVEMFKSTLNNTGFISGKVISGNEPQGGALVVASNGAVGFSSVTDQNGEYNIYNVFAGDYSVKAFLANHNSSELNISVTTDMETSLTDLLLSTGATGQVTGQITFLSTQNIEVDIALTHPDTGETIPGLTTHTSNFSYSISGVPDGVYIGRATYENDNKVVDPDRIVKFGEPTVSVSTVPIELNFDVTGAVHLIGPTNDFNTSEPVTVGAAPLLEWAAYSSTSDYVIEVVNSDGKIIWGGFNNDNALATKNIIIPSSQTSIQFNADNSATELLEAGKIYRWRVYASKDDVNEETGWKLISVSEDQQGLIKVLL